jgi:hypothetical protein
VRLHMCDGVDVVLVQQYYGWLPVDSTNPHWGFAIPGADVDTWVDHLKEWGVPSAMVFREDDQVAIGVPTRVELHFLDPDAIRLSWSHGITRGTIGRGRGSTIPGSFRTTIAIGPRSPSGIYWVISYSGEATGSSMVGHALASRSQVGGPTR